MKLGIPRLLAVRTCVDAGLGLGRALPTHTSRFDSERVGSWKSGWMLYQLKQYYAVRCEGYCCCADLPGVVNRARREGSPSFCCFGGVVHPLLEKNPTAANDGWPYTALIILLLSAWSAQCGIAVCCSQSRPPAPGL